MGKRTLVKKVGRSLKADRLKKLKKKVKKYVIVDDDDDDDYAIGFPFGGGMGW